MSRAFVLFALLSLVSSATALHSAEFSSDAPEHPRNPTAPVRTADSYDQALRTWKTPEDISAWIGAKFSYDATRAMQLSETQRGRGEPLAVYSPRDFFTTMVGVCVDLSRFGVETLGHIDPQSDPKHLRIEFDPVHIGGNTLRVHWLSSFRRDGKHHFFADARRPAHIAGPYNGLQEFIDDYALYRGRRIVAFQELASYFKQRKTQALKRQAPEKR